MPQRTPKFGPLHCEWLGEVPYRQAWRQQSERREAVLANAADEVLWLLEHPAVVTTGLRATDTDPVLAAQAKVEVIQTERGGLATAHEPGQLVGYLIFSRIKWQLSVGDVVESVEDGVIGWLGARGVVAGRREGFPGVWVGRQKLCAIGLHFRKGVSMHGFALNLTNDLTTFDLITPCGVMDGGVTTVERVLGAAPIPRDAAASVGTAVWEALAARVKARVSENFGVGIDQERMPHYTSPVLGRATPVRPTMTCISQDDAGA